MEAYRDQYATLFNNGRKVVVIGISVDADTALASWARDSEFPVVFASDTAGTVGTAYGAYDAAEQDRQPIALRDRTRRQDRLQDAAVPCARSRGVHRARRRRSTSSHLHRRQTNELGAPASAGALRFPHERSRLRSRGASSPIAIHAAAVAGVDPRAATHRAVVGAHRARASAALDHCARQGGRSRWPTRRSTSLRSHDVGAGGRHHRRAERDAIAAPAISSVAAGDHPVPSITLRDDAADRVGALAERIAGTGTVFVLLSGGATSLVAAPVAGVVGSRSHVDVRRAAHVGRGHHRHERDSQTIHALGRRHGSRARSRPRACIASSCRTSWATTSRPSVRVRARPIRIRRSRCARARSSATASSRSCRVPCASSCDRSGGAERAARAGRSGVRARRVHASSSATATRSTRPPRRRATLGVAPVRVVGEPLLDDATFTAQRLVDELVRFREAGMRDAASAGNPNARFACMLWGGETTVRLGAGEPAPGGRCQELALAAAMRSSRGRTRRRASRCSPPAPTDATATRTRPARSSMRRRGTRFADAGAIPRTTSPSIARTTRSTPSARCSAPG